MPLDPFNIPKGVKCFEHYSELKQCKTIYSIPKDLDSEMKPIFLDYIDWKNNEIDCLIRYVIVLIDELSPLYQEANFERRQKEALAAIISFASGKSFPRVLEEIEKEGLLYDHVVFQFFCLINSHDYELWYSLKMNVHRMNNQLRIGYVEDSKGSLESSIKTKAMLAKNIIAINLQLKNIELRLFPNNKRLAKKMTKMSMADTIGGYMERFARNGPWNE